MIYLDTHVVVGLFAGNLQKLSKESLDLINSHDVFISPIVNLELQYLYEIKKITKNPKEILEDLAKRIALKECDKAFSQIINEANKCNWTRDPFDRIIVANARIQNTVLITKDKTILNNYKYAKG